MKKDDFFTLPILQTICIYQSSSGLVRCDKVNSGADWLSFYHTISNYQTVWNT